VPAAKFPESSNFAGRLCLNCRVTHTDSGNGSRRSVNQATDKFREVIFSSQANVVPVRCRLRNARLVYPYLPRWHLDFQRRKEFPFHQPYTCTSYHPSRQTVTLPTFSIKRDKAIPYVHHGWKRMPPLPNKPYQYLLQ
jgi:hypothetical protein